jgi:chemotaxis protein methyltransferase CheR
MFHEDVSVDVVRHFCHIATNRLGVGISASHEALVAGRVAKRLQLLQVELDEYISRLDEDQDCSEVVGFLDFLRPRPPRFFARLDDHTALHTQLVRGLRGGKLRIRLWSAGCGTGEEAYGMALTALSAVQVSEVGLGDVDIKILATDISNPMLDRGKKGVFDEAQLRDVPTFMQDRYFHAVEGGIAIDEDVKDMVYFRRLNLARLPYPMTGPLEAIFCHEGLVPLVASARKRVAGAVNDLLADGGLLCTDFGSKASHEAADGESDEASDEACDEGAADADGAVTPPTRKIPTPRGHC